MSVVHKLIVLTVLTLAVGICGCTPAKKLPSEKTLIKCTTCGVEFTVEEGVSAYEEAHGH